MKAEEKEGGVKTPFALFCSGVDEALFGEIANRETARVMKAYLEGGDQKPKFRFFEKPGSPLQIAEYAIEALGL